MNTRINVVAIIEKEGNILLGKKAKGIGPYPNKWLIPGGGVEKNETLEEALRREVREETNVEIENIRKVYEDEDIVWKNGEKQHFIYKTFHVDYINGQLKPTSDLIHLRWVKRDNLKHYDICKPSIALFKHLGWIV
ncbi:NUDIX hydrolase [Patescibacteria group bacterium]